MRRLATLGLVIVAAAFTAVGQLTITTTSLPSAIIGKPYAVPLQATGDPGPIVWSFATGNLPPNFTIGSGQGTTGTFCYASCAGATVQGAPAQYSFTIQATSLSTDKMAFQNVTLIVENALQILTASLPNAIANQVYSTSLQGAGGSGLYFWSLVSGTLPPGITVNGFKGALTGRAPGANGFYTFTIQLLDQATQETVSQGLTITVVNGLSILTTSLPGATQNVPYSFTLAPSGGSAPFSWSLGSGSPPGITIDPNGTLSGTPTQAGSFTFVITLQDAANASFPQTYTLNVGTAVSVANTSLPSGTTNAPYSVILTAAAGLPTYTWSIVTGSLPPGLNLNQTTGQISGIPTTAGSYPFTAQVKDFGGATATKALTINIGQPLIITTALLGATLGQPYSQTLATTGGTPPAVAWSLITGNLPAGLTLNRSTGSITGTPTALGSSTFAVQAVDSAQQTANKGFTLTVASPVTLSATSFTASVGVAVSQTATASGGVPPYAFTGNLPGGLQISSTGAITGAPTATGTSNVTLQATDAEGRTATAPITITVNSLPLTIVVPAGTGSAQQPGVGVTISAPATGDLNGTLALVFASSVGGDDKMVAFQNGSRSIAFTIPNGKTTSPNATVITGTVAGTITLTAHVPGNPDAIQTIVIAPAAPVISSVALQQVTGGLKVVVTGYSNTREVSTGSFTFTVASGNTLSQATIPVTLTAAYATWFGDTTSNATGGLFTLTVPFSVTQGSATAVTKVSVTLTNKQGTSAAVSSQ